MPVMHGLFLDPAYSFCFRIPKEFKILTLPAKRKFVRRESNGNQLMSIFT
mgnify:CR=1 FL=1